MLIITGLAISVGLTLLPGCVAAKGLPDWVEKPEKNYSRAEYMFGVGMGKTAEDAKVAAVGDLSQQFISNIVQVIKSNKSLATSMGKPIEDMDEIEVKTKLSTSGAFEGIETRERFCCKSRNHHVLVALEKKKAIRNLANRLKSHEVDLRHQLTGLDTTDTPFEMIPILNDAFEPAAKRDLLLAQYRVLSGELWDAQPVTAALEFKYEKAFDESTFAVQAKTFEEATGQQRQFSELRTAMEEKISASRFPLGRGGGGAMRLDCVVNLSEPLSRGDPVWIEYAWNAICEIGANRPGARALLLIEESDIVTSGTEPKARRKALYRAKNAIISQIREEVLRYLGEDF